MVAGPDTRLVRRLALMRGSSADAALAMSKLDAKFRPGLTSSEFFGTFTQCACDMVMTRPAFLNHHCRYTVSDTTDDEADDEIPEHTPGNNQGEDEVPNLGGDEFE